MNVDNLNLNIPNLTVSETKNAILAMYKNAITKQIPFISLPTPFYWGAPGIGKSQSIYQLANDLGKATAKTVTVTEVRLLLFSPVDLRGVPMADEHRKFTNWLKPQIFNMDSDEGCINILFLDELSAAPQSVQAAAYQICLDRKIGEHRLPDNCIVIAAGNRITDQSISYKMPKALCNRLLHINIKSDYASWRKWAVENDISPKIIAYLGFDSSRLCVEPESAELAYPTPRSWSFVSTLLKTICDDPSQIHHLIAGCVGESTAIEFEEYCKGTLNMPCVDDIILGCCHDYPKKHDVLFALTSALVSALSAKSKELPVDQLDNVCRYITHFPRDFVMAFISDITCIEELNKKLMKCPSFQIWLNKRKT